MQFHQLQPKAYSRRGQRVGRGGKRGKTAGRGTKGQKSRAGHKIRPAMRDIVKKFPKLRGFKFKPFRRQPFAVSVRTLARHFASGETVAPDVLIRKGIVPTIRGRVPLIKILGGRTEKKFLFQGVLVSQRLKKSAAK